MSRFVLRVCVKSLCKGYVSSGILRVCVKCLC